MKVDTVEADQLAAQWKALVDELKEHCNSMHKEVPNRLKVLDQADKMRRVSPGGDISKELEDQERAVLAACENSQLHREQLLDLCSAAFERALHAAGAAFGAPMATYAIHGTPDKDDETGQADLRHFAIKALLQYEQANRWREENLDGRKVQAIMSLDSAGDKYSYFGVDDKGPMFIAFAKAMGFRSGKELARQLSVGASPGLCKKAWHEGGGLSPSM